MGLVLNLDINDCTVRTEIPRVFYSYHRDKCPKTIAPLANARIKGIDKSSKTKSKRIIISSNKETVSSILAKSKLFINLESLILSIAA